MASQWRSKVILLIISMMVTCSTAAAERLLTQRPHPHLPQRTPGAPVSTPGWGRLHFDISGLVQPPDSNPVLGRPQSSNPLPGRPQSSNTGLGRPQSSNLLLGRPQSSDLLGRPQGSNTNPGGPQSSNTGLRRPQGSNVGLRIPQNSQLLLGRPQSSSPGLGRPQSSSPGLGRPQSSSPGLGRPQSSSPGLERPQGSSPGLGRPQSSSPGLGRPQSSSPGLGRPQSSSPGLGRPQGSNLGLGLPRGSQRGLGSPQPPGKLGASHGVHSDFIRPQSLPSSRPHPQSSRGDSRRTQKAYGDWNLIPDEDGDLRRTQGVGSDREQSQGSLGDPEQPREFLRKQSKPWWYDVHPDFWFDPQYKDNHRWGNKTISKNLRYNRWDFSRRKLPNYTPYYGNYVDTDNVKHENHFNSDNNYVVTEPTRAWIRPTMMPTKSSSMDRTPLSPLATDMLGGSLGPLSLLLSALTVLFMIVSTLGVDVKSSAVNLADGLGPQLRILDSMSEKLQSSLPELVLKMIDSGESDGSDDNDGGGGEKSRRSLPTVLNRAKREEVIPKDQTNQGAVVPIDLTNRETDIPMDPLEFSHTDRKTFIPVDNMSEKAMVPVEGPTTIQVEPRQLNSLSQIALSAAMVLGAYIGYAFINLNKPSSSNKNSNPVKRPATNQNNDGAFGVDDESESSNESDAAGVSNPLGIIPVFSTVNLSPSYLNNLKNLTLPKPSYNNFLNHYTTQGSNPVTPPLGSYKPGGSHVTTSTTHLDGSLQEPQVIHDAVIGSYYKPLQSGHLNPSRLGKPVQSTTVNYFSDHEHYFDNSPTSESPPHVNPWGTNVYGDDDDNYKVSPSVLSKPNLTPYLTPITTSISGGKDPPDLFSLVGGENIAFSSSTIHKLTTTKPPKVNFRPETHYFQRPEITDSDRDEEKKPQSTYWTKISTPYQPEAPTPTVHAPVDTSSGYINQGISKPQDSDYYKISSSILIRPHGTSGTYGASHWSQPNDDNTESDFNTAQDDIKHDRLGIHSNSGIPGHKPGASDSYSHISDQHPTPGYQMIQNYRPGDLAGEQDFHSEPTSAPLKGQTSHLLTNDNQPSHTVHKDKFPFKVIGTETGSHSVTDNKPIKGGGVSPSHTLTSSTSFMIHHRFPGDETTEQSDLTVDPSYHYTTSSTDHSGDLDFGPGDVLDAQAFNALLKLARREWESLQNYRKTLLKNSSYHSRVGSATENILPHGGSYIEGTSTPDHYHTKPMNLSPASVDEHNVNQSQFDLKLTDDEEIQGAEDDQAEFLQPDTLSRLDEFLQMLLANLNSTSPLTELHIPEDIIPDIAIIKSKISSGNYDTDENLHNRMLPNLFSKLHHWWNSHQTANTDNYGDDSGDKHSSIPTNVNKDYVHPKIETSKPPQSRVGLNNAGQSTFSGVSSGQDQRQRYHVSHDIQHAVHDHISSTHHKQHEVTTSAGRLITWTALQEVSTRGSVTANQWSSWEDNSTTQSPTEEVMWPGGGAYSSFSPSISSATSNTDKTLSSLDTYRDVSSVRTNTEYPIKVSTPNAAMHFSSRSTRPRVTGRHNVESSNAESRSAYFLAQGNRRQDKLSGKINVRNNSGTVSASKVSSPVTSSAGKNLRVSAANIPDTSPTSRYALNQYSPQGGPKDVVITEFEATSSVPPTATSVVASLHEYWPPLTAVDQKTEKQRKPGFEFGLEFPQPIATPDEVRDVPQEPSVFSSSQFNLPAVGTQDKRFPIPSDYPSVVFSPSLNAGHFAPLHNSGSPSLSFQYPGSRSSQNNHYSKSNLPSGPPHLHLFKSSDFHSTSIPAASSSTQGFSPPSSATIPKDYPHLTSSSKTVSKDFLEYVPSPTSVLQGPTTSSFSLKTPSRGFTQGDSRPFVVNDSTRDSTVDTVPMVLKYPTRNPSGPHVPMNPTRSSSGPVEISLMSKFLCRDAVYHEACAVCMEEVGHRPECLIRRP
ncbi:uncharacterized protein LOC121866785 [Homarus americanus]|uniref:uncharacterized protein LOC121866785 n=1 Tax=Homarus americanus TaxID=6706 RepID=UPI001C48FE4E|nr:uncharacterized protein LOC121866785 [Homarus americanus]